MTWVDRLQYATGWQRQQQLAALDWARLESELGTPLPEDYKEICAGFPPGIFSAFLSLLRGGGNRLYDLRSTWTLQRAMFERDPDGSARLFAPYEVYGVNRNQGLLQWGSAETAECQYFWLADNTTDPSEWPIAARWEPCEPWRMYKISTAEFIYRVVADPQFEPLGVAGQMWPPFYLPATAAPTWDPRTPR